MEETQDGKGHGRIGIYSVPTASPTNRISNAKIGQLGCQEPTSISCPRFQMTLVSDAASARDSS